MKKLIYTLVLWLEITSVNAQNFSPFVFPIKYIKEFIAIQMFNDTLYFRISTDNPGEGYANKIGKVDKGLKYGYFIQKIDNSSPGKFKIIGNNLISYSTANSRIVYSIINKEGTLSELFYKGEAGKFVGADVNLCELDNDLVFGGSNYSNPINNGLLNRYSIDGAKVWEKNYNINQNGFGSTTFDFVYRTRNNQILAIGRSQKDSSGIGQTKIISALFDTSGNLIEIKSDLDSLGWQYDFVFKMFRLPRLYNNSCVQLNDSTYGLLIYHQESQLNFPARWVFFNDKGNVISNRKAWMYRDSINNPIVADIYFKGLIKKNNGIGYYAQFLFPDSIDRHRMIELDEDLYITKVFPGIPQYSNANILAGLWAFTVDSEGNFYQLRSLNIDSISSTSTYGSLVCKIDSNGKLLSNGPLFPVGLNTKKFLNDIVIYPNPTHNKISIDCEMGRKMHLEVYGIDGKLLFRDSFNEFYQIDMTEFEEGVYFFKLIDEIGNSLTKKIIRQ